jgi:hypothetical protein
MTPMTLEQQVERLERIVEEIMDKLGAQAEAKGLTPEMLRAILGEVQNRG